MSQRVTVMNATYEIISTTSMPRAVSLVLNGRAVVEESDPLRRLRHKNGFYPYPKLIRLLRFVKVPFQFGPQPWSKSGVLKRDKHTCAYCGKTGNTVDHVIPTSRGGGPRDWLNTVAACVKCNGKKNDKTPREAHMTLNVTPFIPTRLHVLY